MKDFFDLYRIIIAHKFDDDDLMSAIVATFHNRNTEFSPNHVVFEDDFVQVRYLTSDGMRSAQRLRFRIL
jgi:hypothetical protein